MERIEQLKSFLSHNPGDPFLRHALALEYIKAGNETEAKNLFENILKDDPSYVGSYYHLAKLLERQGEFEEALQWYRTGMNEADKAGDRHALNELRAACEDLEDQL